MQECKNSVRAVCSVCVFLGVKCVRICICIHGLAFFFFFWQFLSVFLILVFLGLFVWLQLRSFAFGGHARPSLGASVSSLFLSFSVCVVGGLYLYFFFFQPVSGSLLSGWFCA